MSKRTRQQAILDLVTKQRIPSQAALAKELKNHGFDVTQATLSRDIAELNLVKSKDGYTRAQDAGSASIPPVPDPHGTFRRLVVKVDSAMNLIVIKTSPGGAQPVGIAVDDGNYEQVVGTVAGDDTVLVVTRSVEDAEVFKKKLNESIA
jgi:transcriptional regulator of arginine metabolism